MCGFWSRSGQTCRPQPTGQISLFRALTAWHEWSAAELGIPSADVAAALAPRPPSSRLVADAAKAAGMTPAQLTRQAVHELARSILAQAEAKGKSVPPPARHVSGTQLRKVGN
jgi:type IV secretory pathway VirB6-like protein